MDETTRDRLKTADADARLQRNELRTDYLNDWHDLDQARSRNASEDAAMAQTMESRGFRKIGVIEVEGVDCWNVEYPRDSKDPRPVLRLIDRVDDDRGR